MTSLTNEEAFAELYYSKKAIKDVIGVTVQCWRPPYGDVDDRIRYIAQSLGMTTVIWEDNTFDYEIATLSAAKVQANYVSSFRTSHDATILTRLERIGCYFRESGKRNLQHSRNYRPHSRIEQRYDGSRREEPPSNEVVVQICRSRRCLLQQHSALRREELHLPCKLLLNRQTTSDCLLTHHSSTELRSMDGGNYFDFARCSYRRVNRRFPLDPSLDRYLSRSIRH